MGIQVAFEGTQRGTGVGFDWRLKHPISAAKGKDRMVDEQMREFDGSF